MLDPVSWPCNEFSPCAPNPIIFSCPLSLRPIPFPIFRYTTSSFLIISNPSFLPHSTFCALSCLLTYSVAANFFHPDKRCCKVSFRSPHSLKMSTSTIPFSFFQPLVSIICSCTLKITAVFFWSVLHSSHPFWYPDTISVHLCFSSNLSHLCSFVPSLTMFFSLFHCYCFCYYYYYLCYYCYHCCWVCCILMKGRVQTVALGHNKADKVCFQVKTLLSMWAASNKVILLMFLYIIILF